MKILLYIFILVPGNIHFNYCECFEINSSIVQQLKEKSDLIIIGTPIENITTENKYEEDIVVFQIDSIIKGENLKSDVIMVNQNQAGNCAASFNLCEKYLVSGEKIKSVKQTYRIGQDNHSEKLENLIVEWECNLNSVLFFTPSGVPPKEWLPNRA
uniref:hypothetical protein n=1 Tax=Zunongwangia sp. H14 TaxID=3240792 RepID=UPI0035692160